MAPSRILSEYNCPGTQIHLPGMQSIPSSTPGIHIQQVLMDNTTVFLFVRWGARSSTMSGGHSALYMMYSSLALYLPGIENSLVDHLSRPFWIYFYSIRVHLAAVSAHHHPTWNIAFSYPIVARFFKRLINVFFPSLRAPYYLGP